MSDRSPAPRRSRLTLESLERTSHRTFMRALGLDEAAMAKPFVGVMSTHGEDTPCSLSLRPQAEAAKLGVAAAGGTPFVMRGRGVSAVSRASKSCGSKTRWLVPSCHGRFNSSTMRPSSVSRSRSCATAGLITGQ